ncbi:hypothetical protein [Sutterella sp.]|uniref:hypothetical protein n=1 Tax=Sutterella sp. TaxID=1981025 RepID=UPI0026DEEDCE|nr:hypothetical protein [Sutterella sp.]MDO5532236.1 hypothetical protein [Sutterella sp.]
MTDRKNEPLSVPARGLPGAGLCVANVPAAATGGRAAYLKGAAVFPPRLPGESRPWDGSVLVPLREWRIRHPGRPL